MPLAPGVRLGPYEVLAPVGAGGMGEVYKARDPRLGRDVAVKVLPAGLSADPDRLTRFEQEARAAAALNHPNILAVYDLGQHDGSPYIVSELLEGDTLRERLSTGALPVRKAVEYAIQIAHGLAAAHEKSITHRDLKPENVFVTTDGRVKILDFGLAKLTQTEPAGAALSALPTTPLHTLPGVVLGTIGYMSPEQVRGLAADHHSDIFAFGAILYEILSGRRAFRGETTIEAMTSILRDDPPDLPTTERHIPPALARIVDRCLEKSPSARFQSTKDLAFALEALTSHSDSTRAVTSVPARKTREGLAWTIAAITTLLALAMAAPTFLYFRGPEPPEEMRFLMTVPAMANAANLAVSPDGRWIAFSATSDKTTALFVRPIGSTTVQQLTGTEGASQLFWSPDSRSIAFLAAGRLRRIDVSGGTPETICELQAGWGGGTWNSEGVILFANTAGLHRVPAVGGKPVAITAADPSLQGTRYAAPGFLPDGRHFIYRAWSGSAENIAVYVGSFDSEERKQLFTLTEQSKLVFAEPGFVFFKREGTLFAQPFDAKKLELRGDPIRIADEVAYGPSGNAAFDVSQNGVLLYRTGGATLTSQLAWFDRTGKRLESVGEPGMYTSLDLSPDGKQIAVSRVGPATSDPGIWLIERERPVSTRLTFDSATPGDLIWSPDGLRVAFSSRRKGNVDVLVKSATGIGGETPLLESSSDEYAEDWSKDGKYLAYSFRPASASVFSLNVLPLFGDRKPFPVVRSPFNLDEPRFSFDGKWLAYDSNESGTWQMYVTSFPSADQRRQISTGGGKQPRWRQDARELYYLDLDGKLMVVDISADGRIDSGIPRELFDTGLNVSLVTDQYDVTPDGQRFLVLAPVSDATPAPITVVINWTAGLKK